eukprot:6475267-Amphidinium_carterae.1
MSAMEAKCKEDKEPDVNCVFSDWSEWDCPVTCGRGQAVSSRTTSYQRLSNPFHRLEPLVLRYGEMLIGILTV